MFYHLQAEKEDSSSSDDQPKLKISAKERKKVLSSSENSDNDDDPSKRKIGILAHDGLPPKETKEKQDKKLQKGKLKSKIKEMKLLMPKVN